MANTSDGNNESVENIRTATPNPPVNIERPGQEDAEAPFLFPVPRAKETQRAFLNILEDFNSEKGNLENTQKATINILEDFNAEKSRLEETQRAVLNILDDFNTEKKSMTSSNSG